MKKIVLLMVVALIATINVQAQKTKPGIRMEIAESERDRGEYSVFTYQDQDGTFGYYLSAGRVTHILGLLRDDIVDAEFDSIKETCIWLGATSDEALASLDAILKLFDEDEDTTVEFNGRAATGAEQLGDPVLVSCTVTKKTLGGKRLMFVFPHGKHQGKAYLPKSVVKELRMQFKIDKKLHPKQHR